MLSSENVTDWFRFLFQVISRSINSGHKTEPRATALSISFLSEKHTFQDSKRLQYCPFFPLVFLVLYCGLKNMSFFLFFLFLFEHLFMFMHPRKVGELACVSWLPKLNLFVLYIDGHSL